MEALFAGPTFQRELAVQLWAVSSSVSANTVNRGSPEGCGAPGLEKAPIDSGISQGALCLRSIAQSGLFYTLFPHRQSQDDPDSTAQRFWMLGRRSLTLPWRLDVSQMCNVTFHIVMCAFYFSLCRKITVVDVINFILILPDELQSPGWTFTRLIQYAALVCKSIVLFLFSYSDTCTHLDYFWKVKKSFLFCTKVPNEHSSSDCSATWVTFCSAGRGEAKTQKSPH